MVVPLIVPPAPIPTTSTVLAVLTTPATLAIPAPSLDFSGIASTKHAPCTGRCSQWQTEVHMMPQAGTGRSSMRMRRSTVAKSSRQAKRPRLRSRSARARPRLSNDALKKHVLRQFKRAHMGGWKGAQQLCTFNEWVGVLGWTYDQQPVHAMQEDCDAADCRRHAQNSIP